ncbi:MAG: hypothetical protein ACJAVI_005303 [Candidatus Azotimanducaceae bacterium]|jgi:hypothetical protein
MNENKPPYSVDWNIWGKIRKIEIGDACGLLAGINLPAYRYTQALHMKHMEFEKDHGDYEGSHQHALHRSTDQAESRLIIKAQIYNVVNNHIGSGHFIDFELIKLSQAEATRQHPELSMLENAEISHMFVDLPAFGNWAKATGYELPPEFPISLEKEGSRKISLREMPKAIDMLEGLKSLNDDYEEIDQSDIPAEMQRLIMQYYGGKPTQTQLHKDLSFKGIEISRPTLSKFFKLAFDM